MASLDNGRRCAGAISPPHAARKAADNAATMAMLSTWLFFAMVPLMIEAVRSAPRAHDDHHNESFTLKIS